MHLPLPLVRAFCAPLYRVGLHHRTSIKWGRRITDSGGRFARLPAGSHVEHIRLGARPAERVTVGATERPRAVLYLHGGGYTLGSPRLYRALAAHLSRSAGAVVFCLDYRLAPEDVYPAALDDAVAAFRDLAAVHGFDPEHIAIAGDSAGGGLAVAAARALTDQGLPPGALGLLSPWTDPSDDAMARRDFVTNVAWGTRSASQYRGAADPHDPGYAPMYAELEGLPPTIIQCSTVEMLYPQIERFAERLEKAGVEVELIARPNWWHSIQVLAGTLRDATDAVQDLGSYLRAHI